MRFASCLRTVKIVSLTCSAVGLRALKYGSRHRLVQDKAIEMFPCWVDYVQMSEKNDRPIVISQFRVNFDDLSFACSRLSNCWT